MKEKYPHKSCLLSPLVKIRFHLYLKPHVGFMYKQKREEKISDIERGPWTAFSDQV